MFLTNVIVGTKLPLASIAVSLLLELEYSAVVQGNGGHFLTVQLQKSLPPFPNANEVESCTHAMKKEASVAVVYKCISFP